VPRLTMTVGYDPRFSSGDYGVWVACPPDKYAQAQSLLEFFLTSAMAKVLTLLTIIIILMIRPQGLFTTKVRT